jgi:hypothetical protein
MGVQIVADRGRIRNLGATGLRPAHGEQDGTAIEGTMTGQEARPPADPGGPVESAHARLTGGLCQACRAPLTGRQATACSGRCRAALSRQRHAAAQAAELHSLRATAGPWRFRVEPRGQRFLFGATTYLSDRETGIVMRERGMKGPQAGAGKGAPALSGPPSFSRPRFASALRLNHSAEIGAAAQGG